MPEQTSFETHRHSSGDVDIDEEREIHDIKMQIQDIKDKTTKSICNTIMVGNSALNTAKSTTARLHDQGNRLQVTKRYMDRAAYHTEIAFAKTQELDDLNRSMFVHARSTVKHNIPNNTLTGQVERSKGSRLHAKLVGVKNPPLPTSNVEDSNADDDIDADGLATLERISNALKLEAHKQSAIIGSQDPLIDCISTTVGIASMFLTWTNASSGR